MRECRWRPTPWAQPQIRAKEAAGEKSWWPRRASVIFLGQNGMLPAFQGPRHPPPPLMLTREEGQVPGGPLAHQQGEGVSRGRRRATLRRGYERSELHRGFGGSLSVRIGSVPCSSDVGLFLPMETARRVLARGHRGSYTCPRHQASSELAGGPVWPKSLFCFPNGFYPKPGR